MFYKTIVFYVIALSIASSMQQPHIHNVYYKYQNSVVETKLPENDNYVVADKDVDINMDMDNTNEPVKVANSEHFNKTDDNLTKDLRHYTLRNQQQFQYMSFLKILLLLGSNFLILDSLQYKDYLSNKHNVNSSFYILVATSMIISAISVFFIYKDFDVLEKLLT